MNSTLTIPELLAGFAKAEQAFTQYCRQLPDEQFFHQPENKWSAAQQVKHLATSTNMAKLAFTLPLFMVKMIGGKSNRPSRSFDELVTKYNTKLAEGGKASGRYIPKPIPASYGKEKLLSRFSKAMSRTAKAIGANRSEKELDEYVAPHPLLGKITLRELCYFTIHHAWHHLENIRHLQTVS